MKRLASIFSAALLTFSAACDVDIYVNSHDLQWVGSGTEFYSAWSVAAPADRTDFGAWMHLDASYATSISNQPANGTNFVYRWSDWRGNGTYAQQDSYYTGMPFVSNAFQNGKAVVRFLPFIGSSAVEAPNLQFSEDKTDIFAVFAVLNLCNNCEYVPLLGGYSTYDFHGALAGQLISETFASAKVVNGTNAMDGAMLPVTQIFPTNAFHVVSVRTSGGGVSANNLARDRSFRAGGIDFAELMIFTNPVSDTLTQNIEDYLGAKWGITITH